MRIFKLTSIFVLVILLALGFIIEPRFLLEVQKHDVEMPNLISKDWYAKFCLFEKVNS